MLLYKICAKICISTPKTLIASCFEYIVCSLLYEPDYSFSTKKNRIFLYKKTRQILFYLIRFVLKCIFPQPSSLPWSGRSTLITPATISSLTKHSPMFKHMTLWLGHETNLISLNKICDKIKPNPTFYRISLIVINYLDWLDLHLPKIQSYGIIHDTTTNLISLYKICAKMNTSILNIRYTVFRIPRTPPQIWLLC